MSLTFVSLFAGIGGIQAVDLGLEQAGHTCVGQVEIDPYARRVLEKHWPDVPKHDDVTTFRGDEFGPFDMLAGGYPCQPFSYAGNRHGTGRNGDTDERHLWPDMLRILRAVRPRYAFLENVTGHLSLGFERVLGDLAESGYDAEWQVVPAAATGAPHLRERVFVVAYTHKQRLQGGSDRRGVKGLGQPGHQSSRGGTARSDWGLPLASAPRHVDSFQRGRQSASHLPRVFGAAPRPVEWPAEPDVGRVAHGVPNRVDRLRTLGNAVVPQVAEWIGRRLA